MTTASEEQPQHRGPSEYDESLVQTLASKLLGDWLKNRQQLLVPALVDGHHEHLVFDRTRACENEPVFEPRVGPARR